jgi:uncharacterized protein
MSTSTNLVTQDAMAAMVDKLVQEFHPDKIILFGSYAYGTPTEDSDVDVIVIKNDLPSDSLKKRFQRAEMTVAVQDVLQCPVDLLLLTTEKLNKEFNGYNPVIRSAISQGKVLYECS